MPALSRSGALRRLREIVAERERLAAEEAGHVRTLRRYGVRWVDIGAAMGVSPSQLCRRFQHLNPELQAWASTPAARRRRVEELRR